MYVSLLVNKKEFHFVKMTTLRLGITRLRLGNTVRVRIQKEKLHIRNQQATKK